MGNKDNKGKRSRSPQKRILELEKEAVVQKKIAHAVRVSETRYKRLFEAAGDGILILDANTGEITDVNPFLTDLIGYGRKELLGKKLWEFSPFKDIEISKAVFQKLKKKGFIRYEHLPLESKDGRRVDVEFIGNVYLVNRKKIIQCNIRDITERVLTEEALRKRDAFNKSIIDSSNDCLKILDLDGRLQYMSPGGLRLLGIKDMGRYLNIPYQEFWKGSDHLAALEAICKARQGQTGTFQGYCPTVDGTPKWWDVAITPVVGTDGKPERLLAVSRDITERRQAEARIEHAASFPQLNPNPIMEVDSSVKVTFVNPGMQRSLEALGLGREDFRVFLPSDIEDILRDLKKKETSSFYREVIIKDRIFGETIYLAPQFNVARIYASDITERKRAEEGLRESEEEYRGLFENMLEGFAYCKMVFEDREPRDFIYLSVNHAFEMLTGLKNVIGRKVTEVIPGIKEAHPELFEIYGRVALTGKPERFEIHFEPLGKWFSISVYSTKKEFFTAVFDNITERKNMEEILQHQAYHDNLTDLPNRALFIDRINLELTHARRSKTKVAVLFFDLDRFKNINDSMGHAVGDELLKKVAERLKTCMRESDSAARIGGDEFAMLLTGIVHVGDIAKVAEKIILSFSEPFAVHNRDLSMTTSIGISVYPDDGQNAEDLLKNADSAMYQAKEQGRNNFQFYVP